MESLLTDNQTLNYIIVLILFIFFMVAGKLIQILEIENRKIQKELKKIQNENKK